MEYLPLFADLKRRPVLVVGGGDIAARKIQCLDACRGAQIKVVARELCPELAEIAHTQCLSWIGTAFKPAMLDEVFLVIAATDDAALNTRVYQSADKRHILANVVDDQPQCSFIFPSIIDRTPIVVAISSGGKAPVLARILREKLESLLLNFLGPLGDACWCLAWQSEAAYSRHGRPSPVLGEGAEWPCCQFGSATTV